MTVWSGMYTEERKWCTHKRIGTAMFVICGHAILFHCCQYVVFPTCVYTIYTAYVYVNKLKTATGHAEIAGLSADSTMTTYMYIHLQGTLHNDLVNTCMYTEDLRLGHSPTRLTSPIVKVHIYINCILYVHTRTVYMYIYT